MVNIYNDGHPIQIPDYAENNSRNIKLIPPPIRYDDAQKENNLIQQAINENSTMENPTTNNMAEVILVGGMDENNKSPESFNYVWYKKNSDLRLKWREAIKKEFHNIKKNHVWRFIKKRDVPENRGLFGAKRVFKVWIIRTSSHQSFTIPH